jgi:hypothetical protein
MKRLRLAAGPKNNSVLQQPVLQSRSRKELELQGAASFGRNQSRSQNAMQLWFRRLRSDKYIVRNRNMTQNETIYNPISWYFQ